MNKSDRNLIVFNLFMSMAILLVFALYNLWNNDIKGSCILGISILMEIIILLIAITRKVE